MSFVDAVRTVLSKYAVFSGRARRSEYWWYALFAMLVSIVASVVDRALFPDMTVGIVSSVLALALFLPGLGVSVRRLHDTGKSGWWILIALIPFAFILLIVWYCKDSEGDNAYGPSPKGGAAFAGESPVVAEA